jgi:hypothetical protein
MNHVYWLFLFAATLPLLPLLWLGRTKRLWLLALLPCLAVLLYTRKEISTYYKGVGRQAGMQVNNMSAAAYPKLDAQAEAFLESIRQPLMPLDQLPSLKNWRHALFARLQKDFDRDKQLILDIHPDLTDREALIFYLTARTHGSIPSYVVRSSAPSDLPSQLFASRGNCSDYAIRLTLIADLFGLQTARTSYWTPALPGHVLVEAYDPQEDTAYLLDANFNMIMFQRKPANPGGMLLQLFNMSKEERKAFVSAPGNIRSMPYRLYYADPGFSHFQGRSLTPASINQSAEKLLALWHKSFGDEIEQTIGFSQRANIAHFPLGFKELLRLGSLSKEIMPQNQMDLAPLHKFYDFDFEEYLNAVTENSTNNTTMSHGIADAMRLPL